MSIVSDCRVTGWSVPDEMKPDRDDADRPLELGGLRGLENALRPMRPSTVRALLQNVMATDTAAFLRTPAERAAAARPERPDPPGKSESKATPIGASQTAGPRRGRALGLRQGDGTGSAPSPNIYGTVGARAAAATDSVNHLQLAAKSLLFYFDFASPHAYLAALRVDRIAARHGLAVEWRPLPLGAVFGWAERGTTPLDEFKSGYLQHDCERTARRYSAPFRLPATFPFDTMPACRAFYHIRREDAAGAKRLAGALLHAAFGAGSDIAAAETIASSAIAAGLDIGRRTALLQSPCGDRQLNLELQRALRLGIFGSPFFVVDGEGFWGNDRLDDVVAWLARGGW